MPATDAMDEWLMVGKVVAAQGLRGELRVVPRSDFPERFTAPGPRWLRLKQLEPRPVDLVAGRQLPGKELFVVRLAGIDSREAAEALVGQELLVRGDDRPELAEGEFHLSDLVGLQVRMEADGRSIGTVVDLLSAGNDLLEVELNPEGPGEGQGRRVLVPFVEAIVPTVNLSEGWLGLTPPPGLLDP